MYVDRCGDIVRVIGDMRVIMVCMSALIVIVAVVMVMKESLAVSLAVAVVGFLIRPRPLTTTQTTLRTTNRPIC